MSSLIDRIKVFTNYIRQKPRGEDVRSSIANGIDAIAEEVQTAIDESLLIIDPKMETSGQGADAFQTGELRYPILTARRYADTSSGLFSVVPGGLNSFGYVAENPNRARTKPISFSKSVKIVLDDNRYSIFRVWTYSGPISTGYASAVPSRAVVSSRESGMNPVIINSKINNNDSTHEDKTESMFIVVFVNKSNPETALTEDDRDNISSALHIYVNTDKTFVQDGVPADSLETGIQFADVKRVLIDLNTASKDISDFTNYRYTFGGLITNGRSDSHFSTASHRLRILDSTGSGAYYAGKDSLITANDGYKFNVALYSYYNNANDFQLIGFRNMASGSYSIPQDCYIRISIGTTNDDQLWIESSDGNRSLTTAGQTAVENALVFNLIGETAISLIKNVEKQVLFNVKELTDVIPYNAIEYHALWDEMVENGFAERSSPFYMNYDASHDYPIYTYRIKSNKDWLNSSYTPNNYDGTETTELYPRPKILITSGFHGSERAAPSFLWEFVNRLFKKSEYSKLLCAFDWTIIPLVNPWGYSHSYIRNGNVLYTQSWEPANSTLVVNSSQNQYNGGVRFNISGYDINRDFSDTTYTYDNKSYGFSTQEADYVKSVFISENFDVVIDIHQALMNDLCGFISFANNTPSDLAKKIYSIISKVGAMTDRAMCDAYDITKNYGSQTSYPWMGTTSATFRNYAGGYSINGRGNTDHLENAAKFSLCVETSAICRPYSNSVAVYSKASTDYGNTYCDNFFDIFLNYSEEEVL